MNAISERVKQSRPNRSEVGTVPLLLSNCLVISCGNSMHTNNVLAATYAKRRSLQNGSLLSKQSVTSGTCG